MFIMNYELFVKFYSLVYSELRFLANMKPSISRIPIICIPKTTNNFQFRYLSFISLPTCYGNV